MHFVIKPLTLFTILIYSITNSAFSQTLNTSWKGDIENSLQEFLACPDKKEGVCAGYTGKSLNMIYKVDDFYSAKLNRYMSVAEIAKSVKGNSKWTNLGKPYEQKTLDHAQELANSKRAVIAVYENSQGVGHVVIITPGKLLPSGSWGLNVPNAVSFFPMEPEKSFSQKSLSFAFTKTMMKDVTLYSRTY